MIRNLKATKLDRANFIFLNSESRAVRGNNSNFEFDISGLPVDKNKSYNVFIKNVYFPNNSPQITNNYNYNKINYEIYDISSGTVATTRLLTIDEGTYDSAQLVYAIARVLNADMTTLAATYGGDQYAFIYDDIINRIRVYRNTVTPVGGITYGIRFLANDNNSTYNGEPGFGMGFVLGISYNSTFNLPTSAGIGFIVSFNSPPQLQPYLYFYITVDGVSNHNISSDIENINNIMFRCPLAIGSQRYQYLYIEEAIPEFGQMIMSTLPSIIKVNILDQYGNSMSMAQNAAIDLTIKLVPLD